jgi:hypothetical protein
MHINTSAGKMFAGVRQSDSVTRGLKGAEDLAGGREGAIKSRFRSCDIDQQSFVWTKVCTFIHMAPSFEVRLGSSNKCVSARTPRARMNVSSRWNTEAIPSNYWSCKLVIP